MFMREFPKEATHLSETSAILESCLHELGIDLKKLTTKFIYQKKDSDCRNPYLCLAIDDEEQKRDLIYCMDLELMQFRDISAIELDNKFKLHDLAIVRPFWEKYLTNDEREINGGTQANKKVLMNELNNFKRKRAEIVRIDNATKALQELAQGHEIEMDKGDKDF